MSRGQSIEAMARMQMRAAEYEEQLRREGRPDARSTARRAYGLDATPVKERDPDEVIAALPPTPRDVRAAMVEHYAHERVIPTSKAERKAQEHERESQARRERQAPRDPARIDLRTVGHHVKRPKGVRADWGWTGLES